MMRNIALVAAVVVAAACAGLPAARPTLPLADGVFLKSDVGGDATVSRLVQFERGGESHLLQTHVEMRAGHTTLVVLDAVGTFLLAVTHSGDALRVERAPGVPDEVPAAALLADFYAAQLPVDVVARALVGATVTERDGIRRFVRNGRSVVEIRYDGRQIEYRHVERGYRWRAERL